MLVSNLIYLVWNVVLTLIKNKSVLEYFLETFPLKSILKFILLNDSPFSGRLWYFGAILYTLIIVYFFNRFKKMKILYCMTPVLLLGDLILGKYSLLLLGREFPYIFVRNFLFVGIPYFCIGILISVYLPKIKTVLKRGTLFLVTAFFIALNLLERYILVTNGVNAVRDHYFSTTFLAVSVFILFALSFQNTLNVFWEMIATIGKKYSAGIYIIHTIVIDCFNALISKLHIDSSVFLVLRPLIVFFISLLLVAGFQYLSRQIRREKNNE